MGGHLVHADMLEIDFPRAGCSKSREMLIASEVRHLRYAEKKKYTHEKKKPLETNPTFMVHSFISQMHFAAAKGPNTSRLSYHRGSQHPINHLLFNVFMLAVISKTIGTTVMAMQDDNHRVTPSRASKDMSCVSLTKSVIHQK